jgi:hypothetical protein
MMSQPTNMQMIPSRNMETDNERTTESNSLSLDLEALNSKYSNLLLTYKQAMSDYEESLKLDYSKPCSKYKLNDKVDEECYSYIWQKAGCKTGNQDPAGRWWPNQTMQTLIQDSFLWATHQSDDRRLGCYNTNDGPYMVIGIGTDGRLYYKKNLNANWQLGNDDTRDCRGICTGSDNNTYLSVGNNYDIWTKKFDSPNWTRYQDGKCCVKSIAQGKDGTIIGVGTDNTTYSLSPGANSWVPTTGYGEGLISICIGPNGNIFCTNGTSIFMKTSYLALSNIHWTYLGGNIPIIALTIAPDGTLLGVGNDNLIYTAGNYENVRSGLTWTGPVINSGSVIGITTIVNPNYDPSIYNNETAPNYNINGETMSQIQGSTFWGTTSVGQTSGGSLQDCVASCSSTPGCTGATYNQYNHNCWLRGGSGTITPGVGVSSDSDFAIVPRSKQLLQIMNTVNEELTGLNKQIQRKLETLPNVYATQVQERNMKDNDLKIQYTKLEEDRKTIKNKIDEYQSLENNQDSSIAYITKNYVTFFVLLGIVIIGVIVLAMFTLPKNTSDSLKLGVTSGVANVINVSKMVNPTYTLFGIILVIVIVYLYNEHSYNVYSGVMSVSKKSSKELVIVIIFAIVVAFVFVAKMQKK